MPDDGEEKQAKVKRRERKLTNFGRKKPEGGSREGKSSYCKCPDSDDH